MTANKSRRPENAQISISLERDLLDAIDARARSMSMTRSAYLVHLAKLDMLDQAEIRPLPENIRAFPPAQRAELNDAPPSPTPQKPKTPRNRNRLRGYDEGEEPGASSSAPKKS